MTDLLERCRSKGTEARMECSRSSGRLRYTAVELMSRAPENRECKKLRLRNEAEPVPARECTNAKRSVKSASGIIAIVTAPRLYRQPTAGLLHFPGITRARRIVAE